MKVSLAYVGMFSCVKVLCITTTKNIPKKKFKERTCRCCFLFQFKQLRGVVTMALNPLYRIYIIQNLDFFFSSLLLIDISPNMHMCVCACVLCARLHVYTGVDFIIIIIIILIYTSGMLEHKWRASLILHHC